MEILITSGLPCRSQREAANHGFKMPVTEISRRFTARILQGCVFAFCGSGVLLLAQQASPCKGPPEIEKAIASQPSAAAYDALGAYFGQHNQVACALPAFESAVKLAPGSSEAHYDLGLALLQSGSPQRAVAELRAAARLKPGTPQVHLALGMALNGAKQWDAAIEEFHTVLGTDPASIPALDGISKALIAEERYSAAIDSLKNAPADEVLELNLAIAYSKNGNLPEAIQTLSQIVEKHPSYPQAHSNLGILYTQQNRYREAAQEFQTALKLDPKDDVVRLSYVKALIILAQFDNASPLIQDYAHRKPDSFDALYLSGVVDRGLGNYAQAEPLLKRAAALRPNDYDVRYNLGFVLAKLGKAADAKEQLEKAVRLKPDSSEARFQLAGVLRTLGQQDQAREQLKVFQQQKQASVQQDVAGTKANQANEYLQSGEAQKAVDLYRQSIAEDPKNGHTYYNLALALDRQKDYPAEKEALLKALALDRSLRPCA